MHTTRINARAILILPLVAAGAGADEIHTTYTGPIAGNWSNESHWDAGIPDNNDTDTFVAHINGDLGLDVTVHVDVFAAVSGLHVDDGDYLNIADGQELAFDGDGRDVVVVNAGTIVIGSLGSNTHLRAESPTTLSGGGTIAMLPEPTTWFTSPFLLENLDNTIQGGGNLGDGFFPMVNAGEIVANSAATALIVDADFVWGLGNSGDMRAESGGTLNLWNGTFGNQGGTIRALDGSTVVVHNSIVSGGTLDTEGTGAMRSAFAAEFNGATLGPLTNLGVFEVTDGTTLYTTGEIVNQGIIFVRSLGAATYLAPYGGATTLTGGGDVALDGSVSDLNTVASSDGGSLTNVDNWIYGAGTIGSTTTTIHNLGSIGGQTASAPLVIVPHSTSGFHNDGLLRADAGGTLQLNHGSYDNTDGEIVAFDDSNVLVMLTAHILGGSIDTTESGRVIMAGTPTFESLTTSGNVLVPNGSELRLADTIVNEGTITLAASAGSAASLRPTASGVVLSGGGDVILDATNGDANQIFSIAGGTLHNVDNWIVGGGSIGNNVTTIINDGQIYGTDPTTPLNLDPNATPLVNHGGFLRANGGGTLILHGGTYVGGVIEALPDSNVVVKSAVVIQDALVSGSSAGVVSLAGIPITLDDVATLGSVVAEDAADVRLKNVIHNEGTLTLRSAGTNVNVRAEASDVVLTGGGEIHLDASASDRNWLYAVTGATITNVDNWIHGGGHIGANFTPFINQGTITADSDALLRIDPHADGFDNEGTIKVTGSGGLDIAVGPFATSGTVIVEDGTRLTQSDDYVQTAGDTVVDGEFEMTLVDTALVLDGGRLSGSGVVDGDVENNDAIVAPGGSAGSLVVEGTYTQVDGTLEIELGGTLPGSEYDVLAVIGDANLGGWLSLRTIGGFLPSAGDEFTIMTATGAIAGEFVLDGCEGYYDVSYLDTPDRVVVTVLADVLPGDVDCDQMVTVSDLLVVIAAWGSCPEGEPCSADIDGDGQVGVGDLLLLLAAFS